MKYCDVTINYWHRGARCSAPSHQLNPCWVIEKLATRNRLIKLHPFCTGHLAISILQSRSSLRTRPCDIWPNLFILKKSADRWNAEIIAKWQTHVNTCIQHGVIVMPPSEIWRTTSGSIRGRYNVAVIHRKPQWTHQSSPNRASSGANISMA